MSLAYGWGLILERSNVESTMLHPNQGQNHSQNQMMTRVNDTAKNRTIRI